MPDKTPVQDRDVVYLHQFPRNPYTPNLSPFCLKVETFLRVNDIKYVLCESWTQRSDVGQLPFIELNGQKIGDSQIIIQKLQKHFNVEENLCPKDRAVARAVDRMVEGSMFYAVMNDKVLNHSTQFVSRDVSGMPVPAFLNKFMAGRFANKVRARITGAVGGLSNEQLMEVLRNDLQAINDILSDKSFLFGDRISYADCTVFGHIASAYYLPINQYIQKLLREYIHRIRSIVYPDLYKSSKRDS